MVNITLSQSTVVAGIVTTTAIGLITYYYNKIRKNEKIPTKWRPVGKVVKLNLFPLKSGKKIEMNEIECTNRGFMELEHFDGSLRLRDRCFVVYKAGDLEYRTGRQYPQMVLISVKSHKNTAIFEAPNMNPLTVKIPNKETNNIVKIRHFRDEIIESRDCGEEAASWVSLFLLQNDSGLRLAYHDGSYNRHQVNELYKDLESVYQRGYRNESTGLNSDATAVMLVNEASAKDIIDKLGESEVCSDNFRANIIVSDPDLQPYAEDNWKWIKIGDVVMKNVLDCIRCIMTTINPETGIRRTDNQPLKTLTKYHGIGPENSPVMGICLEVFQTGTFSVGDTVYVSE